MSEARLNLVITAQDQAKQVIEEFAAAIKETFSGLQEEMAKAFNMSPIEGSISEAASTIQRDFSELNIGTILEEQFRSLNETVNATTTAVTEGFNQMAESAKVSSEEIVTAMQETKQATEDIGGMIAAQMIGEQLTQIGEAGKKAFEEAISSAADFEFNMSKTGAVLTTVGKASNSQMKQMADMAINLGSSSAFSANDIAEAMYTLARQGLDAATIMGDGVNGAINVVNDLAQATDSKLPETATVITDVVHEYGLSGSALRDVANIMSGALHNSSESLTDFYYSMRQVGPVASAMHQNALDISSALALLAQHGITGSAAGTAIKNMLLGLSPRTKAAAADFAKLGISVKNGASNSFYDLHGNLKPLPDIINILNEKFNGLSDAQKQAALSTIFTKYGLAGLNTIVGESRDKFLSFQNELKKDDAATIAAKKMDNLHGDLQKFTKGITTMAKAFGDTLAPALRGIVQEATKAVKWMTDLPKPVKEAGMVALGLASALAIVAGSIITTGIALAMMKPGLTFFREFFTESIIGRITGFGSSLGRLGGAARALSFAPLVGGLRSFVGILSSGAGRLLSFGGIFNIVKGNIAKFADVVGNLHFIIPNALKAISDGFGRMASFIVTSIPRMGAAFLRFSTLIYTSGPRILAAMIRAFSWSSIVSMVQGASVAIRTAMSLMMGPWGLLIAAVIGGVAFLITHWSQVTQWVQQHFGSEMPGTLNNLKNTFVNIWNNIVSSVQKAWSYIEPTIVEGIQSVQKWWNSVWPQIYQVLDMTWKLCLAVLAPAIATIGTIIVAGIGFVKGAWQSGWSVVVTILKTAWDLCSGVVRTAWGIISGIISVALDLLTGNFRQAGSDFVSTLKNAFSNITSLFSNLAQDAFNFGANFVHMLASGITGAAGAVTSAVSSVAGKIKSFLGFASPAKEGPAGPGSEMWGPNFVNMMAKGIQEHTPKIQAAVNGIALSMKTGVTSVNHNISQQNISIPSNRTTPNGGTNIYINIDGRSAKTDNDLAEIIAHKIYRQMPVVS